MLFIGSTTLLCNVLLDKNLTFCEKFNSNMPTYVLENCYNSVFTEYVDVENITTNVQLDTTSVTSILSEPSFQPPREETSNQPNYTATIVASTGISIAILAGVVSYLANKKKKKLDSKIEMDSHLRVVMPPMRRAYTQG